MSRTKYEIIEVNNIEVTVDLSMLVKTDDMFFNATEIAKQFDKRPADFWKQSQNEEYLESLITLYGGNKETYVKTRTGRKYGGTWLHQKLELTQINSLKTGNKMSDSQKMANLQEKLKTAKGVYRDYCQARLKMYQKQLQKVA